MSFLICSLVSTASVVCVRMCVEDLMSFENAVRVPDLWLVRWGVFLAQCEHFDMGSFSYLAGVHFVVCP